MTIVIKIAKLSLESKSCKFWVYECKLIIGIKHTLIYSLELFIRTMKLENKCQDILS